MKFPLLLPVVLLWACASAPTAEDDLAAGREAATGGDSSYHLLMAEIALQREERATAAAEYLQAALASDDPDVAARATRINWTYGTPEQALSAARRWAALAPEDPDPRSFLVRLYLRDDELGRAEPHLEFLYEQASETEYPFLELLPLMAEARDRDAALELITRLSDAHPGDASGPYAAGFLALRSGDAARAADLALEAVEQDPEWTEAAMLYARALAADDRADEALAWLEARPESGDPEMQLERAVLLMAAGRDDEARTLLEELLAERPSDPGALRAMGYLDYFAGDLESARQRFMALLGTGRHTNDALFYLGGIAEAEGNIEEAGRLYSRVSGGENLVDAQVRLALVMYRMGRPELAVDHLEEFAEMQPEAALELGVAQAELLTRMNETERALEVYERLVQRYPDSDQLLYSRALLFERLDRVDEAVTDLRRIAERNPEDAAALNALGYTLADRTESHQEAYELIRRANDLDPDNAAIIDSMGWVLYRLGRDDEALPWLERAWSLQRDPEVAAHLGEVLWSMGRQDAARDIWTEAIVEFPGSDVLLETMGRLDP